MTTFFASSIRKKNSFFLMTQRVRLLQTHLQPQMTSASTSEPFITLYTSETPNGVKVSIALEELGLPYKVHAIKMGKMEQKEEWFLKINPNGRIPAITDHKRGDFHVFESGAILLYLAEHYDPNHILLPEDPNTRSVAIQWLMFQMSGVGPMQGQANHFFRYAPEKIQYGIDRYQNETRRLYGVLDRALSDGREYIAGPYTLADISLFGWVAIHAWSGLSLEGLPHLEKWLFRCSERPALVRGYSVPVNTGFIDRKFKLPDNVDAQVAQSAKWVQESNKQDK